MNEHLELVWWLHLATTGAMAGCLWVVQLAVYPLFATIGPAEFVDYHRRYMTQITFVVAPLMITEAMTGALIVIGGHHSGWFATSLGFLGIAWASTFAWQVPLHQKLTGGFSAATHRQLVLGNWVRTVAWTLRAGILVALN